MSSVTVPKYNFCKHLVSAIGRHWETNSGFLIFGIKETTMLHQASKTPWWATLPFSRCSKILASHTRAFHGRSVRASQHIPSEPGHDLDFLSARASTSLRRNTGTLKRGSPAKLARKAASLLSCACRLFCSSPKSLAKAVRNSFSQTELSKEYSSLIFKGKITPFCLWTLSLGARIAS